MRDRKKRMTRIGSLLLICALLGMLLSACGGDLASVLPGEWEKDGRKIGGHSRAAFYDDGTYEAGTEYGQWSVVNGNTIKLVTRWDSDTYEVESFSDTRITFEDGTGWKKS